jgi:putative membrane protein
MTKVQIALAAGALVVFAGCSSDEAASESNYPQPAASQGDEATPAEPSHPQTPTESTNPTTGTAATGPSEIPVAAAPTATATTSAGGESLRDSQIFQVLKSVDQAEIEQATLARNKATDPRVKKFAEHMIEQHSRALKDGANLARKLGATPEESQLAVQLQTETGQTLSTLRGIDSSMFDRMYMGAQVKQHQDVLDLLDKRLIPSAGNPELNAALKNARTMVASHLQEAQQVMPNLKQ